MKEIEKFNVEAGAHYNLISSIKNTTDEHYHDFFEMFLVINGRTLHYVNGARQYLNDGSLVFIRPSDMHFYEKTYQCDCQLINIAFSSGYCQKLFDYLDSPGLFELLMEPKYPVCVELPQPQKFGFITRFEKLYTLSHSQKQIIILELKGFIMELVCCFHNKLNQMHEKAIPSWVDSLTAEMQHKENFTNGLPKMLELACKTQEHLCREFKRHIGKTPTEFINELRLNYAKNLLTGTDINIIDICYDSGFENLSHFYHLFKNRFGTSPASFRKSNQKSII